MIAAEVEEAACETSRKTEANKLRFMKELYSGIVTFLVI